MSGLRGLVSKKKRRYRRNGFDLDLTYITSRVIAMGYPADKFEGLFRNPYSEVLRFLDTYHADHYKVYNLCCEPKYNYDPTTRFHGRVERFPFADHNAPPLHLIGPFCKSVDDYLNEHPRNIVAVHCKAGKGRTGVMIVAWMLFSKYCDTSEEALQLYGAFRTENKQGVTIPSQRRYVEYYEKILQTGFPPDPIRYLSTITLHSIPNYGGACEPTFKLRVPPNTCIYSFKKATKGKLRRFTTGETEVVLDVCPKVPLHGDVRIEFYNESNTVGKGEKMFTCWVNVAFATDGKITLGKKELDKAHKDKHHRIYDERFAITISLDDKTDEASPGLPPSSLPTAMEEDAESVRDDDDDLTDDDEESECGSIFSEGPLTERLGPEDPTVSISPETRSRTHSTASLNTDPVVVMDENHSTRPTRASVSGGELSSTFYTASDGPSSPVTTVGTFVTSDNSSEAIHASSSGHPPTDGDGFFRRKLWKIMSRFTHSKHRHSHNDGDNPTSPPPPNGDTESA